MFKFKLTPLKNIAKNSLVIVSIFAIAVITVEVASTYLNRNNGGQKSSGDVLGNVSLGTDSYYRFTGPSFNQVFAQGAPIPAPWRDISGDVNISGNLGIGNTAPAQKLDVAGNVKVSGQSYLTGNVGIGTGAPGANLTIQQTTNSQGTGGLRSYNTAGTSSLALFQGGDANTYLGNLGAGGLTFYVNSFGTQAMFINTSGSLGLGTANPNGKFEIAGGTNTDGAVFAPALTLDNNFTIQTYIDGGIAGGGWAGRTTYAGACCNNLALQPDAGTVSVGWVSGNFGTNKFNVNGASNFNGAIAVSGAITGASTLYAPSGVHSGSNLLNWPGYNGLTQAYGHYVWPGRNDGSGVPWQQSWYLASNSSYGLYTNTGLYMVGGLYTPIIYDQQNPGYYLDPNGSSNLNAVTINSGPYTNDWYRVNGAGGIYWQAYGGGWQMSDGTWLRSYGNKPLLIPSFNDSDNSSYYIDPAATSAVVNLYRNGGYNGPEYDVNNAGYYEDPNGTSNDYALYRYYGYNGPEYDVNNGAYYVDPNSVSIFADLRSNYYYDANNTGFYMDLDQQTHMNLLYPNSISCMYAWCPANQVMRLTPNLHLNSVAGYATIINWDNGYNAGQNFRVGNGAGSDIFWVQGNGYSRFVGTLRVDAGMGVNGYDPYGCGGYGLCVGGAIFAQSGYGQSDVRLKKDITPIANALDKISHLEGVTFHWIDASKDPGTTAGTHFGFVAQQVEPFIPEAVSTSKDGYKALDYASLTALLAEGIKDLKNQLLNFKDRLLNTENEIQSLKNELRDQQQINNDQSMQIQELRKDIEELKKTTK